MISRLTRRIAAVASVLAALVVLRSPAALAMVGPDNPGAAPTTQTLVVDTVDWQQLALAATVACLVGIAATLAVIAIVRHTGRPALRHG